MADEAAPDQTARNPALNCLAIGSLVAAAALYVVSLSIISETGGSDAAGNAMAAGFAMIAEFLLWIPLGGFVVLACAAGRAKAASWGVALVVTGLGAVAAMFAVGNMEPGSWVRITPALMPPLAAAFGAVAGFGGGFSQRFQRLAAYGYAALAAPLIAAPVVHYQMWLAAAPQREAEQQSRMVADARAQAEGEAQYQARLRALGSNSRLDEFLFFISGGDSLAKSRALEILQTARSRQAETIAMLDRGTGNLMWLDEMWGFNLEVTPALCRSYGGALDRHLAATPASDPGYYNVVAELRPQLRNMEWLMAEGCDLRPRVANLARVARAQPAVTAQDDFAAALENLARNGARPAP